MRTWWHATRRQLDHLALYLPLLVLLLMALGSWVLLRSLPDPRPDVQWVRPAEGPDATWLGLRLKSFGDDGRLQRELRGASGEQDNLGDRMRMRQVEYLALGKDNTRLRVSAQRSEHWQDREEILLTGQVTVDHQGTGAVRTQLWTEELGIWTRQERMRSELPVRVLRANDQFLGSGLDFNSQTGEYTLMGRVRAELAPRHAGASAPPRVAPASKSSAVSKAPQAARPGASAKKPAAKRNAPSKPKPASSKSSRAGAPPS